MKESMYVIKYGEISLKGRNRPQFEAALVANIKQKLNGLTIRIERKNGRIYLFCEPGHEAHIERGLGTVFGIVAFGRARAAEKEPAALFQVAAELAGEALSGRDGLRFKIEARRTDKSFSLTSYQIACETADALIARFPTLTVDVHHPEWTLSVEIREKAYLYGNLTRGLGGLPVGCNGRGLLLLSGGIDSPVAGFLMAKRGLAVDAVYFHTHPFTSPEVKQKVIDIAEILRRYIP
ncbi:MAG TPA: tRNA 4-thiouridine(8) synthase ThiI, partial [Spirochaetia bacterium]|nr:tRNA 4-thiouridine(8) synthase ThiI [Spirochaetia bacterium]